MSPQNSWEVRGPAWAPDGSRIAFWTRFGNGGGDLYAVDPDGSNLDALTTNGGAWPSFSADGSKVLYGAGSTIPEVEIWVTDPAGSTHTQITFVPGLDSYPHWVR